MCHKVDTVSDTAPKLSAKASKVPKTAGTTNVQKLSAKQQTYSRKVVNSEHLGVGQKSVPNKGTLVKTCVCLFFFLGGLILTHTRLLLCGQQGALKNQ